MQRTPYNARLLLDKAAIQLFPCSIRLFTQVLVTWKLFEKFVIRIINNDDISNSQLLRINLKKKNRQCSKICASKRRFPQSIGTRKYWDPWDRIADNATTANHNSQKPRDKTEINMWHSKVKGPTFDISTFREKLKKCRKSSKWDLLSYWRFGILCYLLYLPTKFQAPPLSGSWWTNALKFSCQSVMNPHWPFLVTV